MKYPKRSQYKYAKSRYRIRNWPEFEVGLRRRGDLTVCCGYLAGEGWRWSQTRGIQLNCEIPAKQRARVQAPIMIRAGFGFESS